MSNNNEKFKEKLCKFLNTCIIPIWVLGLLIIIVIVAVICGWKIIYAPELENNWTAIDAIGGWLSAIISGLAIWFAVNAPKRIAQRQDDISLFEKRFICYNCFQKYITIALYLNDKLQKNDRKGMRTLLLSNLKPGNLLRTKNDLILVTKEDEAILDTFPYLFADCYGEDIVTNLLNNISDAIAVVFKDDEVLTEEEKGKIKEFCDYCEGLKKYTDKMKNQLHIGVDINNKQMR